MIRVREYPPLYLLDESCLFPDPRQIGNEDLVAVGGDLCPERLIKAYCQGIFPWFIEEGLVYWFSPDPRLVIFPGKLKISKSLAKNLRNGRFDVRMDTDFCGVIRHCAGIKRKGEDGTWISEEFVDGFCALHEMGVAHSFETYHEGRLVGGLYGLHIGNAFFGESMFSEMSDASKVALVHLERYCRDQGIHFIDCQVTTAHLLRMGGEEIPREEYYDLVREAVDKPVRLSHSLHEKVSNKAI